MSAVRRFIHDEVAGGAVLLAATIVALIWANSPAGDAYVDLWHTDLPYLDLGHWINDGLMALFFFVVGMEISRELVLGELADRRAALLPVVAAGGGVLLPALVFTAIVAGGAGASGWAIPAATDIAFAVGALALLGDRVPTGVRVVLLSIAIVDDILVIAIIALVYSGGVELAWLAAAVAALFAFAGALRTRVPILALPVALFAWYAMHESGVHATIAGVVLGLIMPAGHVLEHRLHPWTAFVVIPIFALANAGIDFGGGVLSAALSSTLTWAVVTALVLGKLGGVAGSAWLTLKAGGALPAGVQRRHLPGIGALAGIGFTVSIFIAGLAFTDPGLVDQAKVGILLGSVVSAGLGTTLFLTLKR